VPRVGSALTIAATGRLRTGASTSTSVSPGVVDECTFEITFLESGVEAYVFTFG